MWKPLLSKKLHEKSERLNRRVTQKEVAVDTGIREPTISQWMQPSTRLTRVDADLVGKLAAYFECDPRELFEYAPHGTQQ